MSLIFAMNNESFFFGCCSSGIFETRDRCFRWLSESSFGVRSRILNFQKQGGFYGEAIEA